MSVWAGGGSERSPGDSNTVSQNKWGKKEFGRPSMWCQS